ncbi:MAG: calcium/proton exchanger [Candidatus Eremiobacteraeota bacterium]|nr:calcium/proton exchanger [Candidatus Eremiobacteraeota bacterium]
MRLFFVLLIFVPLSILFHFLHFSKALNFFISALAIIPLAGFMGRATEEIASKKGPTVGGLMNATFGNATELIIAFIALSRGYIEVVQASITGSIIGNLLLVMGASFLAGGLKYKSQPFNKAIVGNGASMLTIATIGLVVPAMFAYTCHLDSRSIAVVHLSEWVAIALLFVYFLGLVFSLHTHKNVFCVPDEDAVDECAQMHWSMGRSLAVLLVTTIFVAIESELLVDSIHEVTKVLSLTELFVGIIIVAIVGNAAEHAAAIVVALKGKADLSLNISQGSSIQVALFVAPVLVLFGTIVGQPMSLVFTPFEVLAVAVSVIISTIVSMDGESNWFEGVLLLAVYFILAVAFFFYRAPGL